MHRLLVVGAIGLAALALSGAACGLVVAGRRRGAPPVRARRRRYAAGQHRGIDVAGAEGSSVRAPAAGHRHVRRLGADPRAGRHDPHRRRLRRDAVHLGSIGVAKGDAVAEGAPSGRWGRAATRSTPCRPSTSACGSQRGTRATSIPLGLLPPRAAPAPPPPAPAPASVPGAPRCARRAAGRPHRRRPSRLPPPAGRAAAAGRRRSRLRPWPCACSAPASVGPLRRRRRAHGAGRGDARAEEPPPRERRSAPACAPSARRPAGADGAAAAGDRRAPPPAPPAVERSSRPAAGAGPSTRPLAGAADARGARRSSGARNRGTASSSRHRGAGLRRSAGCASPATGRPAASSRLAPVADRAGPTTVGVARSAEPARRRRSAGGRRPWRTRPPAPTARTVPGTGVDRAIARSPASRGGRNPEGRP